MPGEVAIDELGSVILSRREQLRLSQSEAARRAGLARSTWIEIESGKRPRSQQSTLDQIDEALDWEPGTLRAMIGRKNAVSEQHQYTTTAALRQELIAYATTLSGAQVEQVIRFIRSMVVDEPNIFDQLALVKTQLDEVERRVKATEAIAIDVAGEGLRSE